MFLILVRGGIISKPNVGSRFHLRQYQILRDTRSQKFLGCQNTLKQPPTHLARLLGLLLELLDGPLVNATTLVDQVTSGGGLAGIDVADNDNVNVELFLSHFRSRITTNSEIILALSQGLPRPANAEKLINNGLDHLLEQLVDLVLSATEVTTLHEVVDLLPPPAGRGVKLEWPEEVGGILKVRSNIQNLMDQIFNADDSKLAKLSLNDVIGCDGCTVAVDLKNEKFQECRVVISCLELFRTFSGL